MEQDMLTVLRYLKDVKGATINAANLTINDLYRLWGIVANNKRFTDDNANVFYINGKRLFEQVEKFDFYVDGTNDTTIMTAFKALLPKLQQFK